MNAVIEAVQVVEVIEERRRWSSITWIPWTPSTT
jgi:hypothetical protein